MYLPVLFLCVYFYFWNNVEVTHWCVLFSLYLYVLVDMYYHTASEHYAYFSLTLSVCLSVINVSQWAHKYHMNHWYPDTNSRACMSCCTSTWEGIFELFSPQLSDKHKWPHQWFQQIIWKITDMDLSCASWCSNFNIEIVT